MEHDRLERTKGIATRRSERDGPSMAPLAVVATAAPTVSAPAVSAATVARAAAGAGAAARKAQQEQHAVGQGPLIAAASAAAASTATTTAAAAAAANASTDDTTGLPSSPDFACFTPPTPTAAAGIGGRGCSGSVGQLLTMAVGEEAGKGKAGGTVRGLPQRRAGGPAEGTERRGRCARRELEPGASFPPSPPRLQRSVEDAKKGAAVVVARGSSAAADAVADPGSEASKTVEASEAVASMPEEERDSVDGLLEEVRFPLISTSFLCQGTLCSQLSVLCLVLFCPGPPCINHLLFVCVRLLLRGWCRTCFPSCLPNAASVGSGQHVTPARSNRRKHMFGAACWAVRTNVSGCHMSPESR